MDVGTWICGGLARIGLLQQDLHVVAQVAAALAAAGRAALPPAHHLAENVFENVGEAAGAEAALATAHAALLEGRVTEAVIGGALLRVLQRLVGLADFLELLLGAGVVRVAVRMVLHRQLAKRRLQFLLVGALLQAQRLVVVGFHAAPSSPAAAWCAAWSSVVPI